MNTGMINGYFGMENYRMPTIKRVEETSQNMEISKPDTEVIPKDTVTQPEEEKKIFTSLEDISIGGQKEKDYSYIGKDVQLSDLDMEKAISDMKKDNLFQQYQFFVRSSMMHM